MPVPVLAFLYFGSVPVWARFITGPGMLLCPYQYWHCCTLVQYQYWHSPLQILAFNCASTGIGISAFWFSPSMCTVHYQHWHSIMVPVLVLAFLHLGSVPVLAHTITGSGIQKWRPYGYWHCCTMVQYRYGHSLLLVLAFNFAHTGIGISALWFSTGSGTVHYPHWHSKIVPIPVLHFCTLVQYQYGHIPLPELGFVNGSSTGIGVFVLWFIISIGTSHYWYWHSLVPIPVLAFWHFGSVPVWAHSITGTGI